MNVVAKSSNVLPFLRATTVISNGMQPVSGRGIVAQPKIVTKLVPKRIVGQSLQDSLITGPLRVSSGIGGLSHLLVYYVISFHIGFNKIYSSILRLYNHMLYAIHVS